MPKKGKKFFTSALAAVKMKKGKKKALKKHVSSSSESEYSYGSSEYFSSEYTDSDDESEGGSSYTSESDQDGKNTHPPPRKKEQPVTSKPSPVAFDDDDFSDSSSSYGCGVYRRREDITPDSSLASSSYEEESSLGSNISYEVESDYSSSQHSQNQASSRGGSNYSFEDNAPQIADNNKLKVFNNVEESNNNKPKKKSLFSKKLRRSFSGSFVEDDKDSGTASKFRRSFSDLRASIGSMNEASISSKGSRGSESSSKKMRLSFRSRKKPKGTTAGPNNAKRDSTDIFDGGIGSSSDEESIYSENSHASRSSRSSSKVSERSRVSATSSKHSRKSKSSDVSKSSKASESGKASDSKSPQNGVSSPSLFSKDEMSMIRSRAGNGEGAKRWRGAQTGVGRSKIKSGRQSKMGPDDGSDEEPEDTFGTLLEKARSIKDLKTTSKTNVGPEAMKKYKNNAELSHSYKTKTLRNANANLKTSFTDEKPTAEAIANGTSSSRFAAMMRDLQYSSDNTKPNSTVDSASPESDGESDGDDVAHLFQAPRIVSDDDVPVESKENGRSERGNKAEDVRSRFRTRTESMKKLLKSKTNEEKLSDSSDSEVDSDVEVDEEESDEENVDDGIGGSYSTGYSGQPQNSESGAFDDESSGEFSMEDEDEDEYYEDKAMTILTPITEADNETFASTIKPKSTTDDDSVEKYNSMVSPKTPANVAEQKDKEESTGGSGDSASSHGSTSSDDNASSSMNQKNESVQTNGHHEHAGINGEDKQYQYDRLSNQMCSAKVRMPNIERLSIAETIARVKSNDPNFIAFNLDESDLNDFNATRLIFSLKENEHITHISLAQNSLGDGSAASLANLLRGNDTILYLCLRGNQIRDTGAEAIGEAVKKNRTLAHLDLQDNYINSALLESVERRFHLSPPISTDGENSAKINSGSNLLGGQSDSIDRSLLEIDKRVITLMKKANRKLLETAISTAMESDKRSVHENSLLLALSLSLRKLDPEWAINATGVSKSLGERRRLTPWNNVGHYSKELEPSADSVDSDISGVTGEEERKRGVSLISNYRLWTNTFRKIDPRWQIRQVFNDLSLFKGVLNASNEERSSEISSMFTVWRPTSTIAISKMMRGQGVGKGLDIKGKSAKAGILAGFIPFLQIHEEEHKNQIRTIAKGDRTKIFFTDESWRDEVGQFLGNVAKEMTLTFTKAKFAMARSKYGCDSETRLEEVDYALRAMKNELDNPKVFKIDDYAPEAFGIEVSCRVLWKGLVERKDISRNPGSKLCTDRESQPTFQDMNFKALRSKKAGDPVPVLYQCTEEDPFDARTMVLAYEEEGKVVPVVSDFDCFLIGTRKFHYSEPIPPEQIDLLDWCVSQIEWILESHTQPESWTVRWLEVLKFAAENNYCPTMPKFGYGDPTSCSMIEASVKRLATSSGAVRHGPECFNYFFPQELDDKFLIVFPGNQIWKYVSTKELQSILSEKIKEGYTFPLNPKWLLCDPGWIPLFTELLRSKEPSVQHSIDQWFPRGSGLRERILDIGGRFPNGFESKDSSPSQSIVAEQDYERYLVLRRARRRVTSFVYCKALLRDIRERAESDANSNCLDTLKSLEFLGDKRHDLTKVKSSKLERKTLEAIRKLTFFS